MREATKSTRRLDSPLSEELGPLVEGAGVVEELAHRMCWRYKHSSDPAHSHTYTFNRATLLQFADALLSRLRKHAQDAEARAVAAEYAEGQRVAAERERWSPAAEKARAALSELLMTRDPLVYSDALRALDDVLGPNVRAERPQTAAPQPE